MLYAVIVEDRSPRFRPTCPTCEKTIESGYTKDLQTGIRFCSFRCFQCGEHIGNELEYAARMA